MLTSQNSNKAEKFQGWVTSVLPGKECWVCELFIGSALAKTDRIKARNETGEWFWLKWGVQPWTETPQHLQKTPGIHLLPTAHTVSPQLPCIFRNTLSCPRWISECSGPGSAGAYGQMPCLPARSNNGVCLYKMLETHCLKGEEGFIMFFSALGKKQTNKQTNFYNTQARLLVSRWEME